MKEIQFKTRQLTLVSTDVIINHEYDEPFPEMSFRFKPDTYRNSYSFFGTPNAASDFGIIKSMFELLECRQASEMIGRKLIELQYRTKNVSDEWMPWELAGYGSYISDRFIEAFGDGTIFTRSELEKVLRKEYC